MRALLIAAIIVLPGQQQPANVRPPTATVKSVDEKGKRQQPADYSQRKEAEKISVPNEIPGFDNQPKGEAQETPSQKQPHDLLYQAYLWATIIGVFGGLFGLYLIWRQVGAAKASADAASKSAEALKNAERPWIEVTISMPQGSVPMRPSVVSVVFRNLGKTPAKITEIIISRVFAVSIQEVPVVPVQSDDIDTLDGERLVAPEGEIIRLVNTQPQPDNPFAAPNTLGSVWIYGLVRYADSGGEMHGTRFCYSRRLPIISPRIVLGEVLSYEQAAELTLYSYRKRGPAYMNSYT